MNKNISVLGTAYLLYQASLYNEHKTLFCKMKRRGTPTGKI